MTTINLLEWLGYLASLLVLASMLMSSVLKLRIINLTGSGLFSIYGFLIGSLPVGFMNLFIVFANIYHLVKMANIKDEFKTLKIKRDNRYLEAFLNFHKKDILKFFPGFKYNNDLNTYSYLILRNMAVAGVFLARDYGDSYLYIGLDYVTPAFRDLKPGRFLYQEKMTFFKNEGYKYICTIPQTKRHRKYLDKMGFIEVELKGDKHYLYTL